MSVRSFSPVVALQAFPRDMGPAVDHCLRRLGPVHQSASSVLGPPSRRRPIRAHGDELTIPARLYFDPRPIGPPRTPEEMVWAALHTRHHDGWVRQRALAALVDRADVVPWWWVTPWVAQLASEYVREIAEDVAAFATHRLRSLPHVSHSIATFGAANQDFVALARARADSYWDAYHRDRWPDLDQYPGRVALRAFFG